jgi:glucose-1-phosphate cytidylyltransferase
MDTLRDRQILEDMVERGDTPWRAQLPAPVRAAS